MTPQRHQALACAVLFAALVSTPTQASQTNKNTQITKSESTEFSARKRIKVAKAKKSRHHRKPRIRHSAVPPVASLPVIDQHGIGQSSYGPVTQVTAGRYERRTGQRYASTHSWGGVSRFIRGRLVCAVNVNAALAARGIRGTGSALAKSFLRWGRSSGPQPGAVAVFNRGRRGGHVAIVDHVTANGTVIYRNPSSRRQAWVVGPYNRRPIAYRAAG